MEPSNPHEPSHAAVPADDATVEIPRQRVEPIRSAAPSATGQHCAACGATLAPDQRYCVECGQRRGPTRPPFLEGLGGQPTQSAAAPPPKRKPRISPNTALIAGIGTLMLAMATGVLIGRTSAPSTKNAPIEYVNAPAASGTPTTTTGSATTPTSTTEGSSSTNSSGTKAGGSSKTSSSAAAAKVLKGSNAPKQSVVKPGTAGKGPGYQKGHFTGKFFGAGSTSKKTEEEEELGEEPSSSGKGGK